MSDAIELHSYSVSQEVKNDSEEYYEIETALLPEADAINKSKVSPKKEEQFFTRTDVKSLKKKSRTKNKKEHRSEIGVTNIMDVIKLKLESAEPPITKNVIQVLEENKNTTHLRSNSIRNLFNFQISHVSDSRPSWCLGSNIVIRPNFPNFEKIMEKDLGPIARYVKPSINKESFQVNNTDEFQQTAKFLDITFKYINFIHHHSFSLEKMLSIQLEEYYKKYILVVTAITETLKCIAVNRQTRESLIEKFTSINPSKKNDIRFDTTIRKYTEALIDHKDKYFCKLKEKRELANIVVSLWSDIQNVRHKTGYAETCVEIEVKDISLNDEEYLTEWNKVFETEYSDMLVKLEYDYVARYLEYKETKKDNDDKSISKPRLNVNADELKNEVTKIVDFVLSRNEFDIKIRYNKKLLKSRAKSRYDSYKNIIYFKIFVDDLFVCETDHVTIDEYSKVNYNDYVTIQILNKNTTVSVILVENDEDVSLHTVNVNEIRYIMPLGNEFSEQFHEKEFVYNVLVEPNTECTGSGISIKEIVSVNKIRLKSSNVFKGKLYTTCKVALQIGWNNKLNKLQTESIQRFMGVEKDIKRTIHGLNKSNYKAILNIMNNIYDIEIKDPNIINSLKDVCAQVKTSPNNYFLINEQSEDIRFKLLNLRNNGGFSSLKIKTIPLFQSQITTEQLSCFQKSQENDFDVEYIESKRRDLDPIDLQRYMGMRSIEKLNKNILAHVNEKLLRKTHKDVVKDFRDLSWRSIFAQKPNLSLSSCSGKYRQQIMEDSLKKEQEIQVSVLRAFNLFDRRTEEENIDDYEDIAGYRIRPLRPFVTITYRSERVQSPTAFGSQPTWNYTAKLKTKLEPLSSIHINIYDEHKVCIGQGSEESRQSYSYRCHNKWLGTIAIPMNTVINLGKLHGTFKVSTPPYLFGYELSTTEPTSIIPEIMRFMKKHTAFITLRITTSLSHLGDCEIYNQPMDTDDPMMKHLNRFITEYLNDFPTRNLNLTFIDTSGKNKPVTEFLQPLPPPSILLRDPKRSDSASKSSRSSASSRKKSPDKNDVKAESIFELVNTGDVPFSKWIDIAVRYVSLIPTYEPSGAHAVTLMGIELLKVQYGSPFDHTLLLANYFIHLGIRCWVAIGFGLPRGLSSYVLVKYHSRGIAMMNDVEPKGFLSRGEAHKVLIFDAVNGEKHDVRDLTCPLKTVNYVFDMENIWVNVQSSQNCENLSFDFTKTSNWQPVFDKSVFVMQQPTLNSYLYRPPDGVENLRSNLENKIQEKIQKWRWDVRTIWNRYLSNLLRESLPLWEYWSFNPDDDKPPLGQRLKQLMATYKIFGFPINFQYMSIKSVVARLKSTMIHVNDDPKVEFGLAVAVYAYPNNIISVWVFLASMTRI